MPSTVKYRFMLASKSMIGGAYTASWRPRAAQHALVFLVFSLDAYWPPIVPVCAFGRQFPRGENA
jgi:hypothetical protein